MGDSSKKFYDSPSYVGYANIESLADDERQKLWAEQYKKNGFDETICWSLDYHIIRWLLPRLIFFNDYSKEIFERDEFHNDLDEIISVFKEYGEDGINDNEKLEEAWMKLIGHFRRLWI